MKCKYCNAEVAPNARFCTSCGGDLSKFDKCVNCGEFIDKGESTCPHCGTEQPQLVQPQKSGSKTWLWIVVAILLLGILGSGGYLFLSNKDGKHTFVQETDSIAEIDDSVEPSTSAAAKEFLERMYKDYYKLEDKDAFINKYFTKDAMQKFYVENDYDDGSFFYCTSFLTNGCVFRR